MENVAIMMALSGRKLVGLLACYVVDDGKTFIRRAGRILPELRGQDLLIEQFRDLDDRVRENFPEVYQERVSGSPDLISKAVSPYTG